MQKLVTLNKVVLFRRILPIFITILITVSCSQPTKIILSNEGFSGTVELQYSESWHQQEIRSDWESLQLNHNQEIAGLTVILNPPGFTENELNQSLDAYVTERFLTSAIIVDVVETHPTQDIIFNGKESVRKNIVVNTSANGDPSLNNFDFSFPMNYEFTLVQHEQDRVLIITYFYPKSGSKNKRLNQEFNQILSSFQFS